MCDPVTLAAATFAVTATSSIVGFQGAQQAAKANELAANITAGQSANELGRRATEIDAAQGQNTFNSIVEQAKAQGRISASASDMGTGAAVTQTLQNQSANEIGRAAAVDELNSRNQRLQLGDMRMRSEFDRQSQINSVPTPSPLSLALGIAQAGVSSVDTYTSLGGSLPGTSTGSRLKKKAA
jgi:hypothetical protein